MSLSSYRPIPSLLSLTVSLGLSSTAAAAPQATTLDAVQVTAADASAQAREALKRVPGASNVIDVAKADSRLSSNADVLAYQPGISAQSPGNEGTKVSRNAPHRRASSRPHNRPDRKSWATWSPSWPSSGPYRRWW